MARPITTDLSSLFTQLFPNVTEDRPMTGNEFWEYMLQTAARTPGTDPATNCNHERELALTFRLNPRTPWATSLNMARALMMARNGYTGVTYTGTGHTGCGHPQELASILHQAINTDWNILIDIILAMLTLQTTIATPQATPQGGGNNNNGLTQMVSAPKVPEFGDNTSFDTYRIQYRLYIRSIAPSSWQQNLAAITGLMMGWKGNKATFISNVDPESFLKPTTLTSTWDASTAAFLEFTRTKFQPVLDTTQKRHNWETAMNDMQARNWNTAEEFFLAFDTHVIKIQDAGIQPSQEEISRKFVACLPSSVEKHVRPNALDLDTAPYGTYRQLIALQWFNYQKGRAKTYVGLGKRNMSEIEEPETNTIRRFFSPKCSMKTTPPVPQHLVGPISFRPENTPEQNEENRRRREACTRTKVCAKCRQKQSLHANPEQFRLPGPWQRTSARTLEATIQEELQSQTSIEADEFLEALEIIPNED